MSASNKPPTSDEAVAGTWTGSAGSRYTLVNDYPDPTPLSVLNCGTAASTITFGFAAFSIPAGATIQSVQVYYADRKTASQTAAAGARLKVGGNYYNATTHNPATTLTSRNDLWNANPKTATNWTVGDVNGIGTNALQAFGFNASDANPTIDFSAIQLTAQLHPSNLEPDRPGRRPRPHRRRPNPDRDRQPAFYYHAWPEVWVEESRGRGLWLPVDPTLNQFPADATHVRLARGGLDRQAAILGLVGRARLEITDVELRPGATPVLVGRAPTDLRPLDLPLPRRDGSGQGCWSSSARRRE